MSAISSILRQVILLKFLQQNRGGVTLIQIGEYMADRLQADADKYLQRTFQRDKDAIMKNYQLEIGYDHVSKTYRIVHSPASHSADVIEVFNILNVVIDDEELPGQVIFETHKSNEAKHFKRLLTAIKRSVTVRFYYQEFIDDEPEQYLAEPYVLKEFKGRWYLLAMDNADLETKVFALARITWSELTGKKFSYPLFTNPQQQFMDCFGIILPQHGDTVQQVILSFDPWLSKRIKHQPLHATQTELADNETEYRISLHTYITHDLIMEILSYAESVKVIAPESLVEVVKERFESGLGRYH